MCGGTAFQTQKRYTWFKRGGNNDSTQASRIDYFLVNADVANKTEDIEITSATRTDHSLVTLKVKNRDVKRGPGIWKLNNNLLNDCKFCKGMNDVIVNTKMGYSRSKLNPHSKWDYLKSQCKQYALEYTKNAKRNC